MPFISDAKPIVWHALVAVKDTEKLCQFVSAGTVGTGNCRMGAVSSNTAKDRFELPNQACTLRWPRMV